MRCLLRPHLDLGHDEHRQLRHGDFVMLGMYVRRGLDAARRRPVSRRAGCGVGARDAWHHRLFRADPQRHERADAAQILGTFGWRCAGLFRVQGLRQFLTWGDLAPASAFMSCGIAEIDDEAKTQRRTAAEKRRASSVRQNARTCGDDEVAKAKLKMLSCPDQGEAEEKR